MVLRRFKITYACLQLLILVSAHVGWQVHVYTEDLSHFAAHCIDRMPGKTVPSGGFAEDCPVCHFHFFAGIFSEQADVSVGVLVLHRISPFVTAPKQGATLLHHSLRAPPAVKA